MTPVQIANLLGFIAAGIGFVTFIPQALAIHKTKNTKSISLLTFALLAVASVCWLVYAVILNALPVILVNIFILLASIYIVLMKLKYK